MERTIAMSKGMKDHNINMKMVKDSWETYMEQRASDDLLSGFSWPPRSYICSFCKREFRSAQALGGHMNVHRRDRARLRLQSSPPPPPPPRDDHHLQEHGQLSASNLCLNLNTDPNPNYNPSSTIAPTSLISTTTTTSTTSTTSTTPLFYSSFPSSPPSPFPSKIKKWGSSNTTTLHETLTPLRNKLPYSNSRKLKGFSREDHNGCKFLKKGDFVRLDLEIGLFSGGSKEDLDLELRLGY